MWSWSYLCLYSCYTDDPFLHYKITTITHIILVKKTHICIIMHHIEYIFHNMLILLRIGILYYYGCITNMSYVKYFCGFTHGSNSVSRFLPPRGRGRGGRLGKGDDAGAVPWCRAVSRDVGMFTEVTFFEHE
jgi:hypothetical protein